MIGSEKETHTHTQKKTRESAKKSPVARRRNSQACFARTAFPAKEKDDNSPPRTASNE